MKELLHELDCLQEETDRSSFGIPATQGEIEHYEDNKEKIVELLHKVMPYIRSLHQNLEIAEEGLADIQENGDCESSYNQCGFLARQTLSRLDSYSPPNND